MKNQHPPEGAQVNEVHLIWFGNDLRTEDHSGLESARKGRRAWAAFVLDPEWFRKGEYGFPRLGPYRSRFLRETLVDLAQRLDRLNVPLLFGIGKPEDLLPQWVQQHGVTELHYQAEWTRDEAQTEKKVVERLPLTVKRHRYYDQFLVHPDDQPFAPLDTLPEVFTAWRKKVEKTTRIRKPRPEPEAWPESNRSGPVTRIPDFPADEGAAARDDIRSAFPFAGGNGAARERLHHYFWETEGLARYKATRNGLLGTEYSSKFSPWLANGSLSARTVYAETKAFEREVVKNADTYWMVFELLWRDYFKYIAMKHGDRIFHIGGITERRYTWRRDTARLADWISGQTPEPFVNANMIELARTGWMSNRGRQNVASYWAKELEQDWRIGAAYFEYMLLDYDVHSNWGNWMYNSGTGNDPRDRKFHIPGQAQRYDPHGEFTATWNDPIS